MQCRRKAFNAGPLAMKIEVFNSTKDQVTGLTIWIVGSTVTRREDKEVRRIMEAMQALLSFVSYMCRYLKAARAISSRGAVTYSPPSPNSAQRLIRCLSGMCSPQRVLIGSKKMPMSVAMLIAAFA